MMRDNPDNGGRKLLFRRDSGDSSHEKKNSRDKRGLLESNQSSLLFGGNFGKLKRPCRVLRGPL